MGRGVPAAAAPPDESRRVCIVFPASGGGPWRVDTGEAEKLARLVSEHHKAVQLTEIEERFRRVEEELGIVPGPG
jgi:hypothetical protein